MIFPSNPTVVLGINSGLILFADNSRGRINTYHTQTVRDSIFNLIFLVKVSVPHRNVITTGGSVTTVRRNKYHSNSPDKSRLTKQAGL